MKIDGKRQASLTVTDDWPRSIGCGQSSVTVNKAGRLTAASSTPPKQEAKACPSLLDYRPCVLLLCAMTKSCLTFTSTSILCCSPATDVQCFGFVSVSEFRIGPTPELS
ncbi:hypothetical protein M514_26808 [Trichuris suis]|uniref:Uncharacterized protein n=1 Tax=Trichuris suis TaxID=68888 RepID=A0A085MUV5_9BILA|nr:hypothetical protein M514_26808 [Trichuris suis]